MLLLQAFYVYRYSHHLQGLTLGVCPGSICDCTINRNRGVDSQGCNPGSRGSRCRALLRGAMQSVQNCGSEERPHSAAVVQFFHETEPDLWARIHEALLRLQDSCARGVIQSRRQLAEQVRKIRYLTHGHSPRLLALERTITALSRHKVCDSLTVMGPIVAGMAGLAASLPETFPNGLPMLMQGTANHILLKRKQCATILAASLFGAVPKRDQQEQADFVRANQVGINDGRRMDLPPCDFGYLLEEEDEKALCLLSYFVQVANLTEAQLNEKVSFARRTIEPLDEGFWQQLDEPLKDVDIHEGKGGIEDSEGNIQADFANRYLGGATLHRGSVQEEIRFLTSPECIVGMLFCERMLDCDALFIVGARQFNNYMGYGHSFAFGGMSDKPWNSIALDSLNRRGPQIAAFDALEHPGERQYGRELILRELVKAHAACLGDPSKRANPPCDAGAEAGFATGNWGCGAFGGDPQLKALIQWLAASAAGRKLIYFPFGDRRVSRLRQVVDMVQKSGTTCKDLFNLLQSHRPQRVFDVVLERVGGGRLA